MMTFFGAIDVCAQTEAPIDVPAVPAGTQPQIKARGFFSGLYHGMWSPGVALLTLFSNKVSIVHIVNVGFRYNLGFLLGVAIDVLILRRLIIWRINVRRRRKKPQAPESPRPRRRSELIRWLDEDGLPVHRSYDELADELSERIDKAVAEEIKSHKVDDEAAEALLKAGNRALREGLAKAVDSEGG